MKTLIHFIFLLTFVLTSCNKDDNKTPIRQNAIGDTIQWISSNANVQWSQNAIASSENSASVKTINIFTDIAQQEIDGFGGCFNELGWDAIQTLDVAKQEEVLDALFDQEKGMHFNIFRMPIGANDYSKGWYSHNEVADDFDMVNFSIERDRQRLIPYINRAKSYNPNIQIWASPWCPPSWMKTNNHYACQSDGSNGLPASGAGQEMETQFRMESKYLDAYALYFSKFVQAYQNEGIDIYAVHIQNEPNACQNFPSCVWEPADLATMIGKHLGPQFENDNLNTEIWLGTLNRPYMDRIDPILTDPDASKYIAGVGFQWGGKGAVASVAQNYPNLRLMQTESECCHGFNNWESADSTFNLIRNYLINGANSYLYWNMVLDETGRSHWGWVQNSMISIDKTSKAITYNPEYYIMKHFSYYIEAGSLLLETSDDNCLAFIKGNNLVIVYHNSGPQQERYFSIKNSSFSALLEANSYNTFVVSL